MTYSPRCVEKLFGNSELSRIGATKRPRGVKEVPIGCLLAPKKSARDTFCYFPNSFGRGILGSSDAPSCIDRPRELRGWLLRLAAPCETGLHVVVLDGYALR